MFARPTSISSPSIRLEYEHHGAREYYEQSGSTYRNPHEPVIVKCLQFAAAHWPLDLSCVLDLAAGSGEVTLALRGLGVGRIDATDPYTAQAYATRTGALAECFTFADIAAGALSDRRYSLIVCSFAMHLCERSRLPALAYQLAQLSDSMLILTPHKRPEIRREWGWTLRQETVMERVRMRLYCRPGAAITPSPPYSGERAGVRGEQPGEEGTLPHGTS